MADRALGTIELPSGDRSHFWEGGSTIRVAHTLPVKACPWDRCRRRIARRLYRQS